MVVFGGLGGYIIAIQGVRSQASVAAAAAVTAPAVPVVDESELRGYRDILARDPRNVRAAVQAGNLLYDGQRYVEAIAFYQQAFALNPVDINVSTDLGTALWYSGRADEALTQYDLSLKLDPKHAQTLFNVGIVRSDGKRDYVGAVAAWELLLQSNPAYPGAARVRELIADARQKLTR
jgi:tetratricopeptide (TPR) repeat protein